MFFYKENETSITAAHSPKVFVNEKTDLEQLSSKDTHHPFAEMKLIFSYTNKVTFNKGTFLQELSLCF